jgi:hypothetical protein
VIGSRKIANESVFYYNLTPKGVRVGAKKTGPIKMRVVG